MPEVVGESPSRLTGCLSCGAPRLSEFVCEACGSISEIPSDAFVIFGLARSWAIDALLLEQRYEALVRTLREKSSAREDARAGVTAALEALDAARRRLLDPFERGHFLLRSFGGAEREKPLRKREVQSEIMEMDKAAAKARRDGDSARLASVVLEAEEKLASAIMAAGQSFTRLERSLVDEVSAAADALAEARLWRRKVDELRASRG
jgi:DnaJ-domain-containing protein 1